MPARTTAATHPMSKSATKAADDAFYAAHPEMVDAKGKRRPIDPHSASSKELRRQWMTLYAQNGGQIKKAGTKGLSDAVHQARKEVQHSYPASVGVTDSLASCSNAVGAKHAVNIGKVVRLPLPEASRKQDPVCRLVQTKLVCSHGRVAKDGVLYVVPTSYAALGDTIQCTATVSGGCGSHPEWQIGGMWTSTEHGAKTEFRANVYKAALVEGWLGLEKIDPQCYRVALSTCNGDQGVTEVFAYPPDKWGGKIDVGKIVEFWDHVIDKIPADEDEKKKWKRGWFSGSIEYEQTWREEESSHLAYCETGVAGKFEPLLGFESPDFPIWPEALVPPALQDYLKAGLYLKISGGLSFSVALKMKHYPVEKDDETSQFDVDLYGLLKIELSLQLELVDSHLISAKAAGEMGVQAGAQASNEDGWGVDFFAKFTGLEASFTITACWGMVEVPTRKYPIIGESERHTIPWKFTR